MTEHESIRASLTMAVAGLLTPEELRQVEQHAHECSDCRRELDAWGNIAIGLGQLPQPQLPPDLVERTQARIAQQLAIAADRRWYGWTLGALAIFSWAVSIGVWLLVRMLTNSSLEIFNLNLVNVVPWMVCSSMLAWITAATAAASLRHRNSRRVL